MKTKLSSLALSLLLISTIALSQGKETRKLGNFTDLRVSEGIKVELKKGNSNSAEITARGIDLDEVLTDVSGDRLKIHLDDGRHNNVSVSVVLTYKELDRIDAGSAAKVYSDEVIKASEFEVEVSSAGEVDIALDCSDLEVDISSAGEAYLKGKATTQEVEVSSAGEYDGQDLVTDNTNVKASSAGSARVNATKQIDVRASSGGSVRYYGNPDKVRESESSGGSIRAQ